MMIWLLALVLLAFMSYAGYCFGALRSAFTFAGLVFGSLLAFPLGYLLHPLVGIAGVKNPFLAWLAGAFAGFIVVLVIFKVAGAMVEKKVDIYFKYKAGDLSLARWNRMSPRVGACVGVLNGVAYFLLISLLISVFSYATAQLSDDTAAWPVRTLNMLGEQAQQTGVARITAAINPLPERYYDAADIAGLLYHNGSLDARLSRYPGLLTICERPEIQTVFNDKDYISMRQRQASFGEIMNQASVKAVLDNPDLLRDLWAAAAPDLKDLESFLRTGETARYQGEKILGRWDFDLNGVIGLVRRNTPNLPSSDMQKLRRVLIATLGRATFVAAPDGQIFINDYGVLKPAAKANAAPTVDYQTVQGQWTVSGGKYQIKLPDKPGLEGLVEGDDLTISGDTVPMHFQREL